MARRGRLLARTWAVRTFNGFLIAYCSCTLVTSLHVAVSSRDSDFASSSVSTVPVLFYSAGSCHEIHKLGVYPIPFVRCGGAFVDSGLGE